jgi:pimeloyl-ACP methyl ester carboxylesterase
MDNLNLNNYIVKKTNTFKTKRVNGYNILYNESTDANKKHVLFIHGLGGSSIGWRDIPDALSEYFHTICVDLIGFGGSDKPKESDYTINGFSKFIIDFLEQAIELKQDEKISIIGHSLGGYIATQVAIDNWDRVEKLVLIDPSGKLNGPTPLLNQYLDAAKETNPLLRYDKVKEVFEKMYAHPSRLLPIVIDLFNYTIEKSLARHVFELTFLNSTTTKVESERLKQIDNIPCLIIWGKEDSLIPPEYANEFMKDLPNARLEIIGDSGHAPFVEKTALVFERIYSFLTTVRK